MKKYFAIEGIDGAFTQCEIKRHPIAKYNRFGAIGDFKNRAEAWDFYCKNVLCI